MNNAYNKKTIRLTITLGSGDFANGNNTVILEGLAMNVHVTKPGLPEKNSASVTVYNLSMSLMEQLTFLAFRNLQVEKNMIMIEAGVLDEELSLVFKGEITSAYADFSNSSDVAFKIEALSGGYAAVMGTSPVSVNGNTSAADLISRFAQEAGYNFQNNGVTASVRNSVFNGSPIEKAKAVADEIGAELIIDDGTFILNNYETALEDEAIVLNKETGLIGYPSFNSNGISVECLYEPGLRQGGQFKLETIVPKAEGYWKIVKLEHDLSANISGGEWSTKLEGTYIEEQ